MPQDWDSYNSQICERCSLVHRPQCQCDSYGFSCSKCHWRTIWLAAVGPRNHPQEDVAQMTVSVMMQYTTVILKTHKDRMSTTRKYLPTAAHKSTPLTQTTMRTNYLWHKFRWDMSNTFYTICEHLELKYSMRSQKMSHHCTYFKLLNCYILSGHLASFHSFMINYSLILYITKLLKLSLKDISGLSFVRFMPSSTLFEPLFIYSILKAFNCITRTFYQNFTLGGVTYVFIYHLFTSISWP